ncbi:sensor histidine kinase [Actinomadura decatromicini]|uniref:sensor histidine kinase n=1 Tax=Actinomadura decatromicini TaxID=2604572 RepID=UPI001CA3721D|nr:HAMP domain-containing sensor histidine kinase [Actinomadura decatromicini]
MIRALPGGPGSLRRRLVLGATALAAAAVLASQAIGYVVMRSWLLGQVDEQLRGFPPAPRHFDASSGRREPPHPPPDGAELPSEFRLYFYDASGRLSPHTLGRGPKSAPRLPRTLAELDVRPGGLGTLPASAGDGRWRVRRGTAPDGRVVLVALPMDTVDGALSRLLWLNAVVLALTLAALVVAGRWVVRLGLLPLTRMERTAEEITAGRLDERVADADPRTEIGRLGGVLNAMLEQLQGALREHESSEARLRRFVADAGHELRTPLTSIQGFAELSLRHAELPARQRAAADRLIRQNAERMSVLVDDLLLLAKLDQEPVYRSETVDLLAIAADAIGTAAVRHPGRPIGLKPLHDDTGELELVETTGDPHRLRQVLTNLVSNALAHTPSGAPIHVRVGTARAGPACGGDRDGRVSPSPPIEDGTRVRVIEVADEGPGLAPDKAAHLFERFYRVDPSRSRDHGGSGLGLAIAAAIAENHGGRLELDTAPGQGCTFRLVLPPAAS